MEQFITFASNNGLLSAVWVALVVMIIVITIRIQLSPIKQISTQELTFLMNREQGVALDIRKEKEFNTSHILDAINLSNDKITKNGFASLEKHKENPIIVVCSAGLVASKVASDLHKAGFARVSILKGGMGAWIGAGLPVTKK
ncbi:rhodanese-like domain-containing protein [Colwellia sp. 4_MG-2023]|jgi:rhodanese-related sulfurtransferase|uniref:rhodanese-like domain-containing protein n=1 Tax=unclassified Colwellia TaxID=196834 RepID=UPI001C0926A4|nr:MULTISPECIES: rhodanese-like domain-containing protein [unclassified Colwellia]MBU2924912.1 rhodanese-like domain-containing protein [Colwellia sp. C2M11]MDO6487681.1 rhodanese-like domain-containing protein [Colwellia sp. 6_MG-2023]MDO6506811.1 rhodanese-like domain-containing protein [Colwellia sp. 5_MG-2023]MDO6555814.1 rhodanese-like domain-containing protein [Colwellia sp. 4_MG-2023]MDO6652858.1 rhodanese-like domain-containing protein [Colwellia sp. 3_MG-2023]